MKRILIAEDNDSNYMLMTYILKNHYEFFRAHNGQEALEMIRKEPYDMVLTDLKMPIMNGLEATRQMKAEFPDLPVVAITANAFDSDRQQAMEAGCEAFLSKPVSAMQCLGVLKGILGE